jgi:hypothetical protein
MHVAFFGDAVMQIELKRMIPCGICVAASPG